MSRIKYKSCFHVETLAPDKVFLFSERKKQLLSGELHYLLAPLLRTGKHTKDEIADILAKKVSLAQVFYALERLEKAGFIESVEDTHSLPFTVFCQHIDVTPKQAKEALNRSSVFIQRVGKVDAKEIQEELQAHGVTVSTQRQKAALFLLICDNYLHNSLESVHKQLLQEKRPYLMVKPVGCDPWIGPLLVPSETGCGFCLTKRLKLNKVEESYIQNQKKDRAHLPIATGELSTTKKLATNWIATEILKYLIRPDLFSLKGKMISFDILHAQLSQHKLVKIPECPMCGKKTNAKTPLAPLVLHSRKKGIHDENGCRSIAPEITIKNHAHLISPILGIVQYLKPLPLKENSSLYIYESGYNYAVSNMYRGIHEKHFRSLAGGKGRTETQAKASALCEAIERYAGAFQGHERRVLGTYLEMKEQGAIHPSACIHFSKKQISERNQQNKSNLGIHEIPEPFREKDRIEWTPIWSLTEKRYKYIPTAYCYYAYPGWKNKKPTYFASSNGSASGNNLEEAILHGFFELVERDAVAIWWYNRLQRPSVDILSFQDPYFPQFIAQYKEMNREVWVLDLTSDLKIPVFVALSRRMDSKIEQIYMGFGADLQPEIALLRALTEMNQFLHTERLLEKEIVNEEKLGTMMKWFKNATLQNQPYLIGTKVLQAKDFPKNRSHDLLDDIHLCQKIIEDKGMEFLVLDQTRSDVDLKVVKVVVPGLRHFWPRFAPGRLYDVPVEMGWLKTPLKEEELNPIPMFL